MKSLVILEMKWNIPSSLGQLEGSEDEVEVEKFSLIRTLIHFGPEKKRKIKILFFGQAVLLLLPTHLLHTLY